MPVSHCEIDGIQAGLWVIRVDVDDGKVKAFRHVTGIKSRTRILNISGESDLVVGDDVERPTGSIPAKRAQVESLRDDALSGKCGNDMDENRKL